MLRLCRSAAIALLALGSIVLSPGQAFASSTGRREAASGPLKVTGRADCSAVAKADDELLLAVTVAGNHDVCVVEGRAKTAVYLDGRGGMTWPNGSSVWSSTAGLLGPSRFLFFTTLDQSAASVQLRSCAGDRLKVKALEGGAQRFAVAAVTKSFGRFYPVQYDSAGNRIPGGATTARICKTS